MKATHRIKETGIELRESQNAKDLFYRTEKKYTAWTRSDIEQLGLTLEPIVPEKRKLLAWRAGVNIFFTETEHAKVSGVRAPEFDLSFEDEK